jgi:SH3-like domain-containing protein
MKAKILQTIRTFSIAGSLLAMSCIPSFSAEYVSVVKDGTNVRTGPSTSDPVYMELFRGYPLKIAEKKGEWIKIQDFENDSGWIHSSLIEKGNTVIVNAESSVNMRSGPGTEHGIIANLERGVVLDLIERKGNWVQVKHLSGTQGWIYAPLVWP